MKNWNLLVWTLLISSAELFAQSSTLSGKILTNEGNPLSAVKVLIVENGKTARSGVDGNYEFKDIKSGHYTIKVYLAGWQREEKRVILTANQRLELDFELQENAKPMAEVLVEARKSLNARPAGIARSGIDPMDLPQGSVIIGQSVITEQQALRLSDVIKNVNGVYLASSRGATQENFSARGYSFSSSNMFKDAVRINSGSMPEISSLEKVEILKGSAAILYGNVTAGGIINMVTKQPKFVPGAEISMRTGSYDLYKPAIDFYGPLSGSIAYRVIGTYESMRSFRDVVHSQRYYVNPSFLFQLTPSTDLLVQADYLHHDFTPDFGIGSYDNTKIPDVPIHNFYGAAWQYARTRQSSSTVTIKHTFNENWSFHTLASYQYYGRDYYSTERIQALANGDWARPLNKTNTKEQYFDAQVYLKGKFKTGSVSHNILTGIDADRYFTRAISFNQPLIYDSINIFDPHKYVARTDIPSAQMVRRLSTPVNRLGVYIQDLISVTDKIKVLAGLRWSWQQTLPVDTLNYATGIQHKGSTDKTDKALSPRIGIVYKPSSCSSIFVSYSNSFSVNNGTDVFGNALAPSIIDQYEAGVKNDFSKGKLSINLTVYRIVNNNLAQTALFAADGVTPNSNTNLKALTGQTTSDGAELDLAWRPVKGLDIQAGYSYNFIRYTKTPDAPGNYVEGERLINNPGSTGNASAFYTLAKGRLKGLKLGTSLFYTGTRYAGFNNTKRQVQTYARNFEVNGFASFDFTIGYTLGPVSILAKLSNIGNCKNYYVHENYSINPIPPRQFALTVSYKL